MKNSAGSHRAPALADASSTQFSVFLSLFFRQQHTTHTHTDEPLAPRGQLEKNLSRRNYIYIYTRCSTSTQHISAFDWRKTKTRRTFSDSLLASSSSTGTKYVDAALSISHKVIDSERFLPIKSASGRKCTTSLMMMCLAERNVFCFSCCRVCVSVPFSF